MNIPGIEVGLDCDRCPETPVHSTSLDGWQGSQYRALEERPREAQLQLRMAD